MPFTIERNDLSTIAADAIVVAANERLQVTGGVGMTVALAAGFDELQAACDAIGFCPCGSAVATPAFKLNAKVVVHAVGPVWHGGEQGEADFLRSAYDAALDCAFTEGARSVALPLISAGTYGFPADVSLAVARESIRTFLNRHDDVDVRLVLYSRESITAGMASYLDIAEYIDDRYVESYPAWRDRVLQEPDAQPQRDYGAYAPESIAEQPLPAASYAPEPLEHKAKRRRGLFGRIGDALDGARGGREEEGSDRREAQARWEKERSGRGEALEETDAAPAPSYATPARLEDLFDSLDAPFSTTLLALIDERGMTDAQVYKRANMSRQLFSKIRSNADYRPTKKTALALAVALGLNLDETTDLLARAGFALSASSKADVIVEYFIRNGNHDIFEINEALYAFDQPLL